MKKIELLLLVVIMPFVLHAQTWQGDVSSDWNDPGNWQGNNVPGILGTAVFDGTGTNNCDITGAISVRGIDIKAGYTGTISMATGSSIIIGADNFIQTGGTFNCGNASFTCADNSYFDCQGGVFISSSNTITLGKDVNFQPTFQHNNGSIILNSTSSARIDIVNGATGSVQLNNLNIDLLHANDDYKVGAANTLIVNGDLKILRGCLNGNRTLVDTAKIQLYGNFIMEQTGDLTNLASSIDIEFTGNANTTFNMAPGGQTLFNGRITFNKTDPANTVSLIGQLILNNINNRLLFIKGKLVTTTDNILIVVINNELVSGGSNNSFVDGPMIKEGNGSFHSYFAFPIGDQGVYAPVIISGEPDELKDFTFTNHAFRAEYFREDPDNLYDTDTRDNSLTNIGRCEYWRLDRVLYPDADATPYVWLSYDNVRSCGIFNPTDLRVAKWGGVAPPPKWENWGSNPPVTIDGITYLPSGTVVNTFSPFNLASVNSITNPLPVQLIDFSASRCGNRICLSWKTASESNNDHFEIERSVDGRQFNPIGNVNGNGTTSVPHNYSFIDDHPLDGKNFYRIKQVNTDGKFSYSAIIRINNSPVNSFSASITPNPAGSVINLAIEGVKEKENLVFELMNINGITLHRENISAAGTAIVKKLDRPGLRAGLYFYKITRSSNHETFTGKLVLQ